MLANWYIETESQTCHSTHCVSVVKLNLKSALNHV